jgi:ribosomal protein S12 methylthiotransferase accessory factor
MSSNGLASGNSYAEAVNHAVCELLERDATGLFVRSGCFTQERIGEYLIDLESVEDADFKRLHELIQASGLALFAWNETSDFGVPAIGCVLVDPRAEGHCGVYCGGHGCHLSKEIALCRAVTEAAQSRLTEISGARDDLRRSHYQRAYSDHKRRSGKQAFFGRRPTLDFSTLPSLATENIQQDLEVLVELLRAHGHRQLAVADLSQLEHGLAVVKVVIPGLGDVGHGHNLARTNLERRAG